MEFTILNLSLRDLWVSAAVMRRTWLTACPSPSRELVTSLVDITWNDQRRVWQHLPVFYNQDRLSHWLPYDHRFLHPVYNSKTLKKYKRKVGVWLIKCLCVCSPHVSPKFNSAIRPKPQPHSTQTTLVHRLFNPFSTKCCWFFFLTMFFLFSGIVVSQVRLMDSIMSDSNGVSCLFFYNLQTCGSHPLLCLVWLEVTLNEL